MQSGVFEQFAQEDGGLWLELVVQPAINYALVHNRVPLVRHVSVTNQTDLPLDDLDVTLELLGPEGPLTSAWTRTVPTSVLPRATIGWEDFAAFTPEAARLLNNDEAFPVDYRLTVARPGQPEVRLTAPSSVLAHNEWFNSPALYDSLAAFVQPNTRAVEVVLRSAAQILLDHTGSGSLQGYQAGPQRAAQIAGAVYEALRQLNIHYQGLPASFENTGQKVRTTAAVLDGRLGNCLDLSVTYTACLEAAGLHPLIWLTTTHAFAGFLVEEERLGATSVTEANLLISMVESGKAVPVELTRIGPGAETADFTAAVQAGLGHFRTRSHELQGVVDIHLAHRSGIRPLPAVDTLERSPETTTTATVVGSIDLPAGVARTKLRERAEEGDDAPAQADNAPLRVQQWKKSLLDLSLRNPLLNLPKRGRGLELHVPSGALALLDDLIHEGKQIQIIPQDAISQIHELAGTRRAQDLDPEMLTKELRVDRRIYSAVTEQKYVSTMRAIQRDARTMEQETGSNYLYLTLGTLVHSKTTGTEAHAPLFLLPVRIEGGTGRKPYVMVVDGPEIATPNYCLIEWLRVKHDVRIPELENPARDEHGIDIPQTLAAINARLVDNHLNYRIDEGASLRLLQFSTFQMWRDLTDHWPTFLENPVVRHLVESTGATFDDPAGTDHHPRVDEAELHLPIPADGSQMQAIVMAERGQSFVLEGPPGTGKSQTITNLIARAISTGRTVLFVAEKQAALDVVKRRLSQIGLAPFALDLHGRKQSIKAIREQLREALEQYERGGEGTWTAVETGYRARLAPLADYPELVHATNAAGMSVWSAYEGTLAYGDGPIAPVPASYLATFVEQRREVEVALRAFPAAARSARLRPAHPWSLSGRRTVDDLDAGTVEQIATKLEESRQEVARSTTLVGLLRDLPGPGAVADLVAGARLAAGGALPDEPTTLRAAEPRWDSAFAQAQAELIRFRQAYAPELAAFLPEVFTLGELGAWHHEAVEAGKRLFGKGKRLQAIADYLMPYLHSGSAIGGDRVGAALGRLLAARAQASAVYQQIHALGGLQLPPGWLPTNPDAETLLAEAHQASGVSRRLKAEHPAAWSVFQAGVSQADVALLEKVSTSWRAWRDVLRSDEPQLILWTGGLHWYDAWQRDGATWPADLRTEGLLPAQRWGALLSHADVVADAGLTEYRDRLLRGEMDPNIVEEAYHRGVTATSLAERLRASGLEYFDADLHDNNIEQFNTAAGQLRTALLDHLPSVLVRRRPFAADERRGRVAEFLTELRRKRGGKSFRELFQAYPDVILALTPCVLVSPASAANFLAPGAARFDLVVFDEASQIRVAEAIGAMGRGKAAIVVGDSRQMPPTNIMQTSHSGEDSAETDGLVPEDLESILSEAVESGLPQRWLSWHYRSRDESLIAFSNRYYYESKLSSLPSPGTSGTAGVTWRRVNGVFDRSASRTNEVEARAIVAEISQRLHDPQTAGDSIGVVTFNIQQRDLVLNLLEDSTDPLIREQLSSSAAEPIFVKNLENVQGDERDVILFSLAFSTNPATGQLPLNFGPLSQIGGERRLNVAVTRARRQVILFASFDPSDIDLSRTSAVGTQHLRAYCELAAAGVDRLGDLVSTKRESKDRVRDEVATALRDRGCEVLTGHGLSDFTVDIAVRKPGSEQWQVAVMLDSPEWSRRPTVADRDGAPALLRTIMGWPEVVRFWLPTWIRDKKALLERVDAAIASATAAPSSAAGTADKSATPTGAATDTAAELDVPSTVVEPAVGTKTVTVPAATLPTAETAVVASLVAPPAPSDIVPRTRDTPTGPVAFVPYRPSPVGSRSDIDVIATDPRVRALVRESLRDIIAAEGPVEQHRLARLTLARFGFAKTREDRRVAVLALVDPGVLRHDPVVGSFAWPPDIDPATWTGFRTTRVSTDRAFEEIAPEEVANAIRHALASVYAMAEEELLRAALGLLGYQRKTEKISGLLRRGLAVALAKGQVVQGAQGQCSAKRE